MYLEERIEQVERQNETTARAVADLTVDVRAIRQDQTEGFKQVSTRFNQVDARFDRVELRLDRVEADIAELKQDVAELKQDVGTIKQTLQLVLTYLHEKLP